MPVADLLVLAAILLGTAAVVRRLHRAGARGRRLAAGGALVTHGVVLVVMMTAHCADVLYRLAVGSWYTGAAARYDFRLYSLLLLGGVLVAAGGGIVRDAVALAVGDGNRRRAVRRGVILSLVVVAPLLPIHAFFAVPLTALALVSLAVARWASFLDSAPAAPAAALPLAS